MINNNFDNKTIDMTMTDSAKTYMKKNAEKTAHKCPNCENMCLGKQCSECHLKMIEKFQGDCNDCKKPFYAVRPDGTKRKRCKDCQTKYNIDHIAICSGCTKTYHAVLEDGRKFDKCFECYQISMGTACESCNNKSFGQRFCKPCYETFKSKKFNNQKQKGEDTSRPLKKCNTKDCMKQTTYNLCKDCNYSYRNTTDNYMISRCGDCGVTCMGDYKLCRDCSYNKKSAGSR